ncbi:MAG TPA: hypothetical protein VD793_00480 [Gemmatimonadales bacterium]|nr:hypothetical protein [Gemmatimonadales bacterium]
MSVTRVFVNERPVEVDPGASVGAAVAIHDPGLADELARGGAYVTDGVGRPLNAADPVGAGTIIRVIRSTPGTA